MSSKRLSLSVPKMLPIGENSAMLPGEITEADDGDEVSIVMASGEFVDSKAQYQNLVSVGIPPASAKLFEPVVYEPLGNQESSGLDSDDEGEEFPTSAELDFGSLCGRKTGRTFNVDGDDVPWLQGTGLTDEYLSLEDILDRQDQYYHGTHRHDTLVVPKLIKVLGDKLESMASEGRHIGAKIKSNARANEAGLEQNFAIKTSTVPESASASAKTASLLSMVLSADPPAQAETGTTTTTTSTTVQTSVTTETIAIPASYEPKDNISMEASPPGPDFLTDSFTEDPAVPAVGFTQDPLAKKGKKRGGKKKAQMAALRNAIGAAINDLEESGAAWDSAGLDDHFSSESDGEEEEEGEEDGDANASDSENSVRASVILSRSDLEESMDNDPIFEPASPEAEKRQLGEKPAEKSNGLEISPNANKQNQATVTEQHQCGRISPDPALYADATGTAIAGESDPAADATKERTSLSDTEYDDPSSTANVVKAFVALEFDNSKFVECASTAGIETVKW